jgi:hypothetical protein
MKRTHGNTATHQHSNTRSLPAHYRSQTEQYTALQIQHARQHGSNTQRRRGIAHPPTTASSSVQRSHSRGHTHHFHHCIAVAVGSHTTVVRHCICDMQDISTRVALVRRTDCQRPPQPPTSHAQRDTAPPHCNAAAVTHASTQRSETHVHDQSTTQSHAALRSHTAATAKPGAATRTRQHKSAVAILRYNTLLTALETAPATYIARITQPRCFTFSQVRSAPHAYADLRRAAHYHHTTHTRADTHTTRQAPSSTLRRQRQDACHTKYVHDNKPHTDIAHSNPACKHASSARPHDVPHSRNRRAVQTHHHTHVTNSTPHSSAHPTHHPQKITPSHTRGLRATHDRAVRLPSVDGMLPESWLLCKSNPLQDTRTAIASHHGTRRRRRPQPADRIASQRIA